MIRLLLVVAVVFFAFWLLRNVRRLPKEKQKKAYLNLFLWGLVGVLLIGFLTGKMHWIGAIFAIFLGIFKLGVRFFPVLRFLGLKTGLTNPTFSSPTLKCQLNTQSLTISGEIISGEHKGKSLDELSLEELNALVAQTKETDKKGFYLLTVYQQLKHKNKHNTDNHFDDIQPPSIKEAEQILGLPKEYTKNDIIYAHRKLMQKLHPDRGGNDYLASRVNLAKTQLLDYLKQK